MIEVISRTSHGRHSHIWHRERLLLGLAVIFVVASGTALSATGVMNLSTTKWINLDPLLVLSIALWFAAAVAGHIGLQRWRHGHDVILFPSVMLLCGWGIVVIWRLQGAYALRQALWVCIGTCVMLLTVRWFHFIAILRKYPYLALLLGGILTSLTLIVGVHPSGRGPNLWLSIGGISLLGKAVYMQPSELLKPLLAIFLAAYLSRHGSIVRIGLRNVSSWLPIGFLAPMMVMWGLSLFMVIVQRDMGAGWVLYWGFLCIFYFGTGRRRYIAIGMALFLIGTTFAYFASELVQIRIHGWLNPWSDVSGQYYQIVQAINAMDAGGMLGTGIGVGTSHRIPLAHSDFIFPAIVNEYGSLGGIALGILAIVIVERIWKIGIQAPHGGFLQLLILGVGSFIAVQSAINIFGVLRVMPLTGVPLPFVSYGGSAMVINFLSLGFVFGHREKLNGY